MRRLFLAFIAAVALGVGGIVLLIAIAIAVAPNSDTSTTPTPDKEDRGLRPTTQEEIAATDRAAPAAAEWRIVRSWKGSGMKETETFTLSSREWRVSWATANEAFAGAGLLQIYVYNDAGELVSLAANKQGTGQDTSYIRGAGRHHLMISSANVDWVVAVEEQ